jgi:hypothetical protein
MQGALPPHFFEIRREVDGADIVLVPSQRNAPALFGAGMIDRIPDRNLEEVAAEQARSAASFKIVKNGLEPPGKVHFGHHHTEVPLPLAGRVVHLKDRRIGRFGWKANVATLREFTLQACANELGLEVPGFPKAAPPWDKNYKAPGLDLTAEQCDTLIAFVASLRPPAVRAPETTQHASEIAAGQKLFAKVGCTACHLPKLGDADGIYSDLLVHDMGQQLSDFSVYGSRVSVAAEGQSELLPALNTVTASADKRQEPPKFGTGSREWRTPPLWGLRDSTPYLHDGRADTIADAIAMHGGEGLLAAQAFFELAPSDRQRVELFLQSLAAPAQ